MTSLTEGRKAGGPIKPRVAPATGAPIPGTTRAIPPGFIVRIPMVYRNGLAALATFHHRSMGETAGRAIVAFGHHQQAHVAHLPIPWPLPLRARWRRWLVCQAWDLIWWCLQPELFPPRAPELSPLPTRKKKMQQQETSTFGGEGMTAGGKADILEAGTKQAG